MIIGIVGITTEVMLAMQSLRKKIYRYQEVDILTKIRIVQAMVFPVKKRDRKSIDAFELCYGRRCQRIP